VDRRNLKENLFGKVFKVIQVENKFVEQEVYELHTGHEA
jgi:hypothetical protein